MTRIDLLSSLAVAAIALGTSASYGGTTCVWTGAGSDNDWMNTANWQSGIRPVDGDSVVIQAVGTPLFDATAASLGDEFASFTLQTSASVTIDDAAMTITGVSGSDFLVASGAMFRVEGSSGVLRMDIASDASVDIDGTVLIDSQALLDIVESIPFSGDGSLQLGDAAADTPDVEIAFDKTLTNTLALGVVAVGDAVIQGTHSIGHTDGRFLNNSLVKATGTISLSGSTPLESSDGDWEAAGGIIRFAKQELDLRGDLINNGGVFVFDANVRTRGSYSCSTGSIDMNATYFRYLYNPNFNTYTEIDENQCSCADCTP